jgi:mono/diheme cytochrome c family protein
MFLPEIIGHDLPSTSIRGDNAPAYAKRTLMQTRSRQIRSPVNRHLPAGSTLLILFLAATSAVAQPPQAGQLEKGRAMAERLCAQCHMNEGQGEKQGPMGIPGFRAVANRPNQSALAVVDWLRAAPAMMPDHKLTWDEADALATFIMSLREPK